jgi:hypothetical protein
MADRAEEGMIAALYVATGGAYFGIDGVDPWDAGRDARTYAGPWPVVAHPPCERWGRYWSGGPSARVRRTLGDDGGCFAAALAAVRTHGGVIEHPEASHAWRVFGLRRPSTRGWWSAADEHGWTCQVEQGHYGHRARKATWLYAVRCDLPELTWGPAPAGVRLDCGYHSTAERKAAETRGELKTPRERLGKRECAATPPAFRDILVAMARSAIDPWSR